MRIDTVTVLGANGAMGANVSGLFASIGGAKVYMVARSLEKAQGAVERAMKAFKDDSFAGQLIPVDYSSFPQCVAESDLVFESVREEFETKSSVMKEIGKYAHDNVVIGGGTSGLSITALAENLPEHLRSRYFGIHFFNPPYSLKLCELTPTVYSDTGLLEDIRRYLTDRLQRTTVQVKDAPCFLGNRVGFHFINKALQAAEQYKEFGGIDYIDAILGTHIGRKMAPLATSDLVGLDVHKAIVDNIYENTDDDEHERFVFPAFAKELIHAGKLGRKTKAGLYKLEVSPDGEKRMLVYDILTGAYRDRRAYDFSFVEAMNQRISEGDIEAAFKLLAEDASQEADICRDFLSSYIRYGLFASKEVGYDIHAADDVMAAGFGWCPPLALAEAVRGSGLEVTDADNRAAKHNYQAFFKRS